MMSHSFFGPFICFRKIDWRNVGALQHKVGLIIPHLLQLASIALREIVKSFLIHILCEIQTFEIR